METRGLLSRISVRGTPTDVHVETIHTQFEASYSTLRPVTRTVINDRSLKDRNGVEQIGQRSSAGYRRIRKQARANRRVSSARTPPAA